MEAARHFDAADDGDGAAIRALGDRLEIRRLVVADERAARVVRDRASAGREPEETVADAIEIGARVLEREAVTGEVDYVRVEFERTAGELREVFSESAREANEQLGLSAQEINERLTKEFERVFGAESGELGKALESHAGELADQIAGTFDSARSGAVQHQIREMVQQALVQSRQDLVRQFHAEDGSNPLADFKNAVVNRLREAAEAEREQRAALQTEISELKVELARLGEQSVADERVAEAEEAGTRKGLAFEDRVHAALERIADGRGDAARHTGGEMVLGGGKKGDAVVEIGAADGPCQGRLVFEAKDRKLSRNAAWQELNAALEQREADFGVLVVAGEDRLPSGVEILCEYEGDKLIVAVDRDEPDSIALEAAYRYARARVLLIRRASDAEVDAGAISDAAAGAIAALKRANGIKRALTEATKSVDGARDGLEGLIGDVRAQLERIEGLAAAGE